MVLSELGLIPHPAPENAEKTIDSMRDAALGYDSTQSVGTGDGQLERGLRANGAKTTEIKPDIDAIDAALVQGHPVIIGSSSTWAAWGQKACADGAYLNHQNPGGHYVTVLGKAPEGNYIIGDPLSKAGAIEATPDQMKTLLGTAWDGIEVSR
jgi:hypothetical protein